MFSADEATMSKRVQHVVWHLLHAGRADLAVERASHALGEDPDNPDLQAVLAAALIAMRRWVDAEASATAALARDPDHVEAQFQLARIATETGRRQEAAGIYERLLAQAPENANILAGNARLLVLLRKPAAARPMALRALEVDPDHADAHRVLALACIPFWRHRHEARKHAELALQLEPHEARSHFVRGIQAYFSGRPFEARRRFREAKRLDPMMKGDARQFDAELAALWHRLPLYYAGLGLGAVRGWKWPLQVLVGLALIGAAVRGFHGREPADIVIAVSCFFSVVVIETVISRAWIRRRLR